MRWKVTAFFRAGRMAVAAACLLMTAAEARADYRFCNATSFVLESALGVETASGDGADAQSRGWWTLYPGTCTAVRNGPIDKSTYYVFARSSPAHPGGTKTFSGEHRFCTGLGDFTVKGRRACAERGFDAHEFIRVETESGPDWTTTFREPSDYSLAEAQIAGAQRLLKAGGYKIGRIDGISGRGTERAVRAFQKEAKLRRTGRVSPRLFAKLVEAASRRQEDLGLSLCNRTGMAVWSAVGYRLSDGHESAGWVRIEPGSCRKLIKDKLDRRYYYYYAEAVDETGAIAERAPQKPMVWRGDHAFCLNDRTRFAIRSRERCEERGYRSGGFVQVDTGDSLKWEVELN